MRALRLSGDETTGQLTHEDRLVALVYLDDCVDHLGKRWWGDEAHADALEEARGECYAEGYGDGHTAAEEDSRGEMFGLRMIFDDLIELVGRDAVRSAARSELRSTAVKQALSLRGVL